MPEDLLRLARICRDQAAGCGDTDFAEVLRNMAFDYEHRAKLNAALSLSQGLSTVSPPRRDLNP
jgi:hypothetical protein